jgi:hypothetical protein
VAKRPGQTTPNRVTFPLEFNQRYTSLLHKDKKADAQKRLKIIIV